MPSKSGSCEHSTGVGHVLERRKGEKLDPSVDGMDGMHRSNIAPLFQHSIFGDLTQFCLITHRDVFFCSIFSKINNWKLYVYVFFGVFFCVFFPNSTLLVVFCCSLQRCHHVPVRPSPIHRGFDGTRIFRHRWVWNQRSWKNDPNLDLICLLFLN